MQGFYFRVLGLGGPGHPGGLVGWLAGHWTVRVRFAKATVTKGKLGSRSPLSPFEIDEI